MACLFCERTEVEQRVFYDQGSWYAILALPQYVKGHAVLVAKPRGTGCPDSLTIENLQGLEEALSEVVQALREHYTPKDVLLSSLRGREPHVHFHLVPLWPNEEDRWRSLALHDKGHLFEFLGYIERTAQEEAKRSRLARGWTKDEQRLQMLPSILPDVSALRSRCNYRAA